MASEINKTRKQIGQRWFNLALAWSKEKPETKRDMQTAIRAMHRQHGGSAKMIGSLASSLEQVENLSYLIREARRAAREYRNSKGHVVYRNHGPYTPPSISILQRLRDRIKIVVENRVRLETKTPERDNLYVEVTHDPNAIGMELHFETVWPYSGSKNWPAKQYTRVVKVPHRYLSRVFRKKLDVVGGLVTLDAALVDSPDPDVVLYAATWLTEGRGFKCHTTNGFIAFCRGENFHGKTITSTVRGVRNKLMSDTERESRSRARFETSLKNIEAASNGTRYRMCHAEKLGFCEYGIRSWCNRVGLDPRASATMKEIIRGYREAPLTEVRKFILYYGKRRIK